MGLRRRAGKGADMTYCKHKPVFCECQPDEGMPCPHAPADLSMPNAWPGLARDDLGGYATAEEFAQAMPNDAADTIERQAREIERWRNVTARADPDDCAAGIKELYGRWKDAEAERDALRECVRAIVTAYDGYRRRGVAPAPVEYADVVTAIDAARAKVR